MNEEKYFNKLDELLEKYYTTIKVTGKIPLDQRRYLEGYIAAVQALGLFQREILAQRAKYVEESLLGIKSFECAGNAVPDWDALAEAMEPPTFIRKPVKP